MGIIAGMTQSKKPRVDEFGKAIARHLSARRAHQRITQAELERLTQISQSQLSKQLRGQRAIDMDEFDSICSALHVPMEEIIRLAEMELDRFADDELAARRAAAGERKTHDEDNFSAYAADSSPDEPEEGDEGFGEGP